ncbi:M23 family metallopeptidase [Candidatus Beckwithbacteria bacterium]|nr:M23 family metallopeptidase [Candidatus Beckwithbacteria bacterium]
MQSGFSYGIRKGTNYIKTQGWNFAKAKLSPFVNQVGNRIFGEAGKAALSTGVKKLAGTAITKLGGALTANVIPVAGQVASALMLADTVIETVGDKIPIVGKPVTNFYRGAKNSFLEILKKIGQAATALMVYLFSNPFVLFGAGSGAFVGSFIPGIGPFLGAFLGGTLGWIASQLLSGLKAVIPYTASNVAIASANTLNAVASQTGGVPSWLAATPYYAVGGLTVGTFLTMSVLMTAFSLPPFEKMNYTGIYIPNMPYAIDTSCNNKNLPEDFPKIAPVDSGQMTAGPGATTSKSQHGNAVDIGIPVGTPVKATHAGTVIFAGNNITDYGRMVQIESVNGFNTRYAHLDTIAVSKGSKVSAGQIIGTSGDTGNSTGPHLHYELNANQYPVSIVCTFADSQTAQGVNGCVDNCNYNF